ncbi:MAG: hypothetical protein QOG31_683 [Thermoplasmata archaeon]|nr:hypothetical protein [Thermoplasmata archaeon]
MRRRHEPRVRVPKGVLVAAVAVLCLGLTFAWKNECTVHGWDDHYQYRHYCYSDILPLYWGHHLSEDKVPYLDEPNEYPVLTGFYMYGAAKLTSDLAGYMVLSFVGLLACAALATWALWRLLPTELVLAWLLVPTIAVHGLTNWDLLAVACACWGWHEWRRGRPLPSSVLFGLGGAAKLYPVFFLPFLLAAAARKRDARGSLKVVLGGFLGFGVPNLVVAILAPKNWLEIWLFHARRSPDFETPWESFLHHYGQVLWPRYDWGSAWTALAGEVTLVAMAATTAWLVWRIWRRALDPLVAGGVLSLVFLLVNKVYSPQYTLWAVPLLLLLGAAWRPFMLFVAADTVNFFVRYNLFTPPPGQAEGWNDAWSDWSRLAVNLRWVFLAWALWTILVRQGLIRRRVPTAVPAPGPAAPQPKPVAVLALDE